MYASDMCGARPLKFEARGQVAHGGATDAGRRIYHMSDKRVRRSRSELNDSFRRGTSIYMCWSALVSLSWTFDILVSTLS
jgi:hypothetical protein